MKVVVHKTNGRVLGTWVCSHVKTADFQAGYVYRKPNGKLGQIQPTFATIKEI